MFPAMMSRAFVMYDLDSNLSEITPPIRAEPNPKIVRENALIRAY